MQTERTACPWSTLFAAVISHRAREDNCLRGGGQRTTAVCFLRRGFERAARLLSVAKRRKGAALDSAGNTTCNRILCPTLQPVLTTQHHLEVGQALGVMAELLAYKRRDYDCPVQHTTMDSHTHTRMYVVSCRQEGGGGGGLVLRLAAGATHSCSGGGWWSGCLLAPLTAVRMVGILVAVAPAARNIDIHCEELFSARQVCHDLC
mgnify:CR=1 FL=1